MRQVRCLDHLGRLLRDQECDPRNHPPSMNKCNEEPCSRPKLHHGTGYKWKKGPWTEVTTQYIIQILR